VSEWLPCAFEDAVAADARIERIRQFGGDSAAEFEIRVRAAAQWEIRTREALIAALNRLAAALEKHDAQA